MPASSLTPPCLPPTHTCTPRRPAASAAAAPADAREAQLALAGLVESMTSEAASLHRQLGRLTLSSGGSHGGDGGRRADSAASGGKGEWIVQLEGGTETLCVARS